MALPLSVVIITRNEAARLSACLESVAFAGEILVVDSGSTDETVAIAQQHSARVVHQPWLGFGPQKQFAVQQASHDWVLCIDADERVSETLRNNIEATMQSPTQHVYRMPRCNRFLGRWLRFGEGYPDFNIRLFHRAHAQWSDDVVHEHVITRDSVGTLSGDLLHESQETIARYLEKQNGYTTLQAERLAAAGAYPSRTQLVLSPLVRFIKFYIVRQGFRDGVPGLVHIAMGCFNSFIKYAKLLELRRSDKQ